MNKPKWVVDYYNDWGFYPIAGGGGGGDDGGTVVQAPATPAPSATESAADIYQARLQYDPQMAALQWQTQQQYMPQQAALYNSLYQQYYPEIARSQQALQRELYPFQSQLVEQGAQDVMSRLQNPDYMTPEEQAALEAQRGQQLTQLQRSMQEQANMGGGLFGGRAQAAQSRDITNLLQSFETQDYQRRMGAAQAAQQAAIPYMQIMYPQVGAQQPNISPYQYQSAVPDANALYQAMFQASQPQSFYQPAGGLSLGILGQYGRY